MVKPARRDGIQRYEQLLDAALRCFDQRGVLGTRIEDIRREAGASPSSMYYYFDGFDDLVVELLARTFARLFADITAVVTREVTAEGSVRALVTAQVDWVFEHPGEARFIYQASALELGPEVGSLVLARKAQQLAPLLAHLQPFIASGELPAWAPEQLDVVLLGPTHEACRRQLAGVDLGVEWMRENLPGLAWASLGQRGAR